MTFEQSLRALNEAAYAAARSCPNEEMKRRLKQICFETDALVDALPSRAPLDFCGEVPALQSAVGGSHV